MLDLIAKLEAASGPDRELDLDIWCNLFAPNAAAIPLIGLWNGPWFTSSIDAALTLVPDDCDRLINFRYGYASVWQSKETGKNGKWSANNIRYPAIALCIAALKARLATQGAEI